MTVRLPGCGEMARMFESVPQQKGPKAARIFGPATLRYALIGAIVGLVMFVALHLALGRPDNYAEKFAVVVVGAAALGALVGIIRGRR